MTATAKPTPAQHKVITYFNGGPIPAGRVTEATYAVCRREGWIEPIEEFPFHRTTDLGRQAIGRPAEQSTTDTVPATMYDSATLEELARALAPAEVAEVDDRHVAVVALHAAALEVMELFTEGKLTRRDAQNARADARAVIEDAQKLIDATEPEPGPGDVVRSIDMGQMWTVETIRVNEKTGHRYLSLVRKERIGTSYTALGFDQVRLVRRAGQPS